MSDKLLKKFVAALLKPDLQQAIELSHKYIDSKDKVQPFWEEIILPSLYSVGEMWSNTQISVGEEHTATSICQRVMAEHYDKVISCVGDKKQILVITGAKELHQLGALMLSDILELNGYPVTYMDSSNEIERICDTIEDESIEILLISLTIVSNAKSIKKLISQIRKNFKYKTPKIIVGGQAFIMQPELAHEVDADDCITSINNLLEKLEEF